MPDNKGDHAKGLKAYAFGVSVLAIGLICLAARSLIETPWLSDYLRSLFELFGTTGVIAIGLEYWQGKRRDEELSKQFVPALHEALAEAFDSVIHTELPKTLAKAMLEELSCRSYMKVYPNRQAIHLDELFRNANYKIDILTTNLDSLTNYINDLAFAAQHGVKIRLLTLNPNHEFVARRAPDLDCTPTHFFNEIKGALCYFIVEWQKIHRHNKTQAAKIQLRLYSFNPSLMMFRVDSRIILSFILQATRGRNNMHIELDCGDHKCAANSSCGGICKSDRFSVMTQHFDHLWQNAECVTPDDNCKEEDMKNRFEQIASLRWEGDDITEWVRKH